MFRILALLRRKRHDEERIEHDPWATIGRMLTALLCSSSSDAWVGDFQKATSGLSTSEAAKRSATAVFEVSVRQSQQCGCL